MTCPQLSLIIPCYNEAKNIPLATEKFRKSLEEYPHITAELIIVDNNSKDNTARVLQEIKINKEYAFVNSVFEQAPGFGAAVSRGLSHAQGTYIGWTHADMQTDPRDAFVALELILANPNKLIYAKGKRYGRPLLDSVLTLSMSIFETLYLHMPLFDINAQPNIFNRDFLQHLKSPPTDFSFDLYAYYLAKKNKYTIMRFPVHFGKRMFGESSWNTGLRARWKFIKRTISFTRVLKKKFQSQFTYE